MTETLKVEVCSDFAYIRSVMIEDEEMYGRAANDHTDPVKIQEAFGSARWLECIKDDQRIGLAAVKVESSSVLNIHISIQKQFRGKGTIEMGRLILKWVIENTNGFSKINTKVPVIYKDVIRFAHKLGFKDEGIDRLSIMKNGKLIDRQNLGITFSEVQA